MKSDFKFSNLLGTVYKKGNLVFTEDGSKLLSPVGNRVSCFDLIKSQSFTFPYQHRKNIQCLALNKQNTLMISIDEDGRAILVNFISRIVLHHFNFKSKVNTIKFSPCGNYFAVAIERFVQVWKTPDFTEERQFAPFVRHRIYSGHFDDVLSVSWSQDSRFFISTSKDMTAKIYSIDSDESNVSRTFSGHRDNVINAFFSKNQEIIYTISKDGALFKWEYTEPISKDDEDGHEENHEEQTNKMEWRITEKNFFYANGKLKSSTFHAQSNLLVVGFSNGEFRVYEIEDGFNLIQSLSMGQNTVNTVSINNTGEWLAFGSSKLGQLLVYEWQSESYILKQQGHFDSMNTLCYTPDGSRLVTGSDDGKIKIWDVASGFCLVTFTEHTSAVTQVQVAKKGHVLFSASLDGTIRAYDLIRFRNFKTFTAASRIQFNCLAVDPSGEIIVGGSQDSFEIFVWSVQTGQLLESLTGHEGPISCLTFGQENSILASASWDKTVRVWNIFARNQTVEPIEVQSDVLCLCMRPDCKELSISTLDGHITIFDIEDAKQLHLIDGRKDIISGRFLQDKFVSKNSNRGKYFSTITYSFDGSTLLAGGNNNSICMYDIDNEVLIKRFIISENMSIDGTLQKLNSSKITDAGINSDLLDKDGENSDLEDRMDLSLPGSNRGGDPTERKTRPEIRCLSLQFSPTTSAFAAATTEGLLIYSINQELIFDPFDLDVDITPESALEALKDKEYLLALIMALRLNESYLIHQILENVPLVDIKLVCQDLPKIYVNRILNFIGELFIKQDSPHIEFYLIWIKNLLISHGAYISSHKFEFRSSLKLISRYLNKTAKEVVAIGKKNDYLLSFLTVSKNLKDDEQNINGDHNDENGTGFEVDEEVDGDEDIDDDEELVEEEEEDDDEGGWLGPDTKKSSGIKFSGFDGEDDSEEEDEEEGQSDEELIEV
ncbi:PWP2 [Candida pseudojiufengensis]|uniref:PWP2 n=1 Tax=Candida pseudojiufengensis TaxID=497109 RepID=UPI002224C0A2|nr:PWP2 [Candida pseudojiufengensis]KAI5963560.1 PWP2 [Candida pseudojiufengensis]